MTQQRMKTGTNLFADEQVIFESVPLYEAVGQLPRQYMKVLCRPSIQAFGEEMGNASWGLVVIQLCLLLVLTVSLSYLAHLIPFSAIHTTSVFSIGSFRLFAFLPSPYNGMAFILGSFVIGLGTAYLFSRLWQGRGSFLWHAHSLLLCTIPLVTLSGVLLLIPATGPLVLLLSGVVFMLFVYRMVLHVLIVMAVHGLSATKATFIVLIIPMSVVLIAMLALVIALLVTGGEALGAAGEGLAGFLEFIDWQPGGRARPKDARIEDEIKW